jgi:hypothetical protein
MRLSLTRIGALRPAPGYVVFLVRSFLPIGLALFIFGVVMLVRTVQFVSRAERTTGTVVAVREDTNSDGDTFYYPDVEFTTAAGETIRFSSNSGSSTSRSEGDQVDVLYDPNNPHDARLAGLFDVWLIAVIPLILGAVFIPVGWFLWRRTLSPAPT